MNDDLVETYLRKRSEKLSSDSLQAYRADLKSFVTFTQKAFKGKPIPLMTDKDIALWLQAMSSRGLSLNTRRRRLSVVRGMYQYLIEMRTISVDPTLPHALPRAKQQRDVCLQPDDLDGFLRSLDPSTLIECRDAVVVRFIYATGARISELLSLQVEDVDLKGMTALIRGSGRWSVDRRVSFDPETERLLQRYLALTSVNRTDQRLLLTVDGRPVTRNVIWKGLRLHMSRYGLPRLTPNGLRRAFAAHRLQRGVSLERLRDELGVKQTHQLRDRYQG